MHLLVAARSSGDLRTLRLDQRDLLIELLERGTGTCSRRAFADQTIGAQSGEFTIETFKIGTDRRRVGGDPVASAQASTEQRQARGRHAPSEGLAGGGDLTMCSSGETLGALHLFQGRRDSKWITGALRLTQTSSSGCNGCLFSDPTAALFARTLQTELMLGDRARG